jgi:hypothetical protein
MGKTTNAELEAAIVSEHYFTARHGRIGALDCGQYVGREKPALENFDLDALGCITFCVLQLKNGFTITGEYTFVSQATFDAEIGRAIARKNAIEKLEPMVRLLLTEHRAHIKSLSNIMDK